MSLSTTIRPSANSSDAIPVSPEFRKQAFKAIAAIAAFIAVYLVLMALSLVLVAVCVYAGFWVIVSMPKLITILVGAGLVGLGVMVFVFLIKFLFARSGTDSSDSIEITEEEQPQLFAFIRQVTAETKTPFPKKIFISPDVNACVFYHSSFWSMFLPVRKNLKIGLGVVNCLNVSEFKAVIAHEFGHFSQRSMKVGSYTYQVNRIIYDLLFQNKGFGDSLSTWSSIHGVFAFFAHLTVQIILAIQWVLRQMYVVVNKSYMALSRQMEFHADLVASTVSGNNNIVSALQKVEFADACFSNTLELCNQLLKDKKVASDIYEHHGAVTRQLAGVYQIPLKNGMPLMNEYQHHQPAARVNFKDQWASHPTLQERKEYVESFDLYQAPEEVSAWSLFQEAASLRQQLTRKLYEHLPQDDLKAVVSNEEFEERHARQLHDFSLPKVFKGYYDNRRVDILEEQDFCRPQPPTTFEALLSDELAALPKKVEALKTDIATLEAIEKKQVDTKTFDLDGHKYSRRDAATVKAGLQEELEQLCVRLAEGDKALFSFFYQRAVASALDKGEGLKQAYDAYFKHRRHAEGFGSTLEELFASVQPLYSGQPLQLEEIHKIIANLKAVHEPLFKRSLHAWTALGAFEGNDALKEKADSFIRKEYSYFHNNQLMENEFSELNALMNESWSAVNLFLFEEFKKVVTAQAALLELKEHVYH